MTASESNRFVVYTARDLPELPELKRLRPSVLREMQAVAAVLPFRVNRYVLDELIDWDDLPGDPIFQLTFPQPGMLSKRHRHRMVDLIASGAPKSEITTEARHIQHMLNPHPSGQMQMNVPQLDGRRLPGIQHKYDETVLFFPTPGQTCHAYCTYCFRWAQFVGIDELKFASKESQDLVRYVRVHPEIRSVLLTGGDPMVMKTEVLRRYVEPLLELPQLESIRIGTKALAYWPFRFTTDDDADDLMRLFEQVVASGKNLAFMAHFSHPRELSTSAVREAIARIHRTGAVIRSQAPLIRHVNDDSAVWSDMWSTQTALGIVPYYMFVERDTGASHYFRVPLADAFDVFHGAYTRVSGLARTVRGPSMSATPGKVVIDGISEIVGERVFSLRFLRARDPDWVGRPFHAKFDAKATWLDQLRPAFGQPEFFFEAPLRRMQLANERAALRLVASGDGADAS